MAVVTVKELLKAGVHYGHHASRWNPKMRPYIYGKRNSIHIINLIQTTRGLLKATRFLTKVAARGEDILLVGTKRQAAAVIASEAVRGEIPYVNERWLGGTLTNFQTIRSRLGRLMELENLENTGRISNYKKKEAATLMREKRKILRNLDGLRKMERHPGAVIVIDPRREKIAILEAKKLGIPVVALLDTDSDPQPITIPIPGNDDAIKSIQVILSKLVNAVMAGRELAGGSVDMIEQPDAAPPQDAAAPAEAEAGESEPEAAAAADASETPAAPEEAAASADTGGPAAEEPEAAEAEAAPEGEATPPAAES